LLEKHLLSRVQVIYINEHSVTAIRAIYRGRPCNKVSEFKKEHYRLTILNKKTYPTARNDND